VTSSKKTIPRLAAQIADWATDLHVVIGPVRWQPSDGTASKRFYFIFSTAWPSGFQNISMQGEDEQHTEQIRLALYRALVALRRPIVLHDMSREIDHARLVEQLWPCERATRLRQAVEKEHAERNVNA
jgi:hypothetical protein